MKPSLAWRAPALLPLLAALAGCPQKQSTMVAPAPFDLKPSQLAATRRDDIVAQLGKQETGGLRESIRKALSAEKNQYVERLLGGLTCGSRGCYVDFDPHSPEEIAKVSAFVTAADSPLRAWNGWRYVSGLYSRDGKQLMTVVLMSDKEEKKKTTAAPRENKQ
jgi:hypothetical protein